MTNKMRNYRYNAHGTVDCEVELFSRDAIEACDAIYQENGGEKLLISEAIAYAPAVAGEWHPTTLDYIPESVVIAPYVIPHKTKEHLIEAVAALRYQVETAGITIGGKKINTNRESQTMLAAAIQSLTLGLIEHTNWKDGSEWVQVNLATLTPIARAVANHVSDCFTAEMQHCQAIGSLVTQAAIDAYDINQGWAV